MMTSSMAVIVSPDWAASRRNNRQASSVRRILLASFRIICSLYTNKVYRSSLQLSGVFSLFTLPVYHLNFQPTDAAIAQTARSRMRVREEERVMPICAHTAMLLGELQAAHGNRDGLTLGGIHEATDGALRKRILRHAALLG